MTHDRICGDQRGLLNCQRPIGHEGDHEAYTTGFDFHWTANGDDTMTLSGKSPPQASEKARELVADFGRKYFASLDHEDDEPWAVRRQREYEARSALLSYIADIEQERDKARVRCSRTAFKIIRSELAAANERIAAMQKVVDAADILAGHADRLRSGFRVRADELDALSIALDDLSQPTEDAAEKADAVSVPVAEIERLLSLLERHGYGKDGELLRRIRGWLPTEKPA